MTAIESALLIDMIINGRWMLHDMLVNAAQRRHEYDLRRPPQSIVDAILIGILAAGLVFMVRLYRARVGAALAVSGVLISLVFWCIDVISLHAVDAILYHLIGRMMVVSFVWILACSMTSVGILIDSRRTLAR